jgi:hypothetical protein
MGNVREDKDASWVADEDTPLGRPAKNTVERRATLQWCLDNPWANKNIGRIERVDGGNPEWHGWGMWLWQRED